MLERINYIMMMMMTIMLDNKLIEQSIPPST